ncbi:GNAT family N-acetyltransferase [Aquirufa sp. ROCK2-A2]
MENKIEIIDFTIDLQDHIRLLNYEWLEKYFKIEEGDYITLSNPQKYIIEKGGYIYYAKFDEKIVGTASLIKKSEFIFELGKMAVTKEMQGLGIGKLLIEHCLRIAHNLSIQTLILYSNTKLEKAIHLYQKFGFQEIELENGIYERANIKMKKVLIEY